MTDTTMISSHEVRHLTVTAELASADQWERTKSYTDTIRYRVEKITLTVGSLRPGDVAIVAHGRRVLKDGRLTDRVQDRIRTASDDLPQQVLATMLEVVAGWRVLAC